MLSDISKISVSDGFSYLVPASAIDLAILGNLKELIYHFINVLFHANEEKESSLKQNWTKKFSNRKEGKSFLDFYFMSLNL